MASIDESHFGIFLISKGEETILPAPFETNTHDRGSASSFCKSTSAVWNDFESVIIDGILKAKYKKYAKVYSYASSGRIRNQKSYITSDARL